MSEILEALKKLDREKAARRSGTADIAAEILTPGAPRSAKRLRRSIAIVCFTAVVAAAITYAVVMTFSVSPESAPPVRVDPYVSAQPVPPVSKEPSVSTRSAPSAVIPRPVQTPQAPPAPREPDAATDSPAPVRVPPVPPVQQVAPAPTEPALPVKPMPPAATAPPVARPEPIAPPAKVQKPVEKETISPAIPATPAPPVVPPGMGKTAPEPSPSAGVSAATPSSFRITVIVWDEEPSKRWAMINGMKAAQGSVIEGVKVEEITLTGVRLFHNGRYFEVPMN